MKHNSSPFAQFVLCTHPIAARFSCFPNMQQPTQQTFFAALTMPAWEPYRKVPCSYSWFGCSEWLWFTVDLMVIRSGALQSFAGSYCRHLKYFTAVGFHPGGHSCIDDEILGDACCSCSTRIQA